MGSKGSILTEEQLRQASENIDIEQDKVRASAYNKICKDVFDTDLPLVQKNIISWALAEHFGQEYDIFETKEKWIELKDVLAKYNTRKALAKAEPAVYKYCKTHKLLKEIHNSIKDNK